MNYFVTKDDLDKAVDAIFSAIARMFSEEDERFEKKLRKMESETLLLINTVGRNKSHQPKNMYGRKPVHHKSKNKRSKKMEEEPRAIRPFDEVLADLIDYVLQSEDHDLILLSDELFESAKIEVERRETTTKRLREIIAKGKGFLKSQGFGEKKEPSIDDLPEGHKQQTEEKEKKEEGEK